MSIWERIDSNGQAHALTQTQDKRARQKFSRLMETTKRRAEWEGLGEEIDEEPDHVVIGRRRDGTRISLIGNAFDLHGPDGVCTCCPRTTTTTEAAEAGNEEQP